MLDLKKIVNQSIVARYKSGEFITNLRFLENIQTLKTKISSEIQTKVAISISDPYNFLVAFLASLSAQKKLIILPNLQSSTPIEFKATYDLLIDEAYFDKTLCDNTSLSSKDHDSINVSTTASVYFYTSGSSSAPKCIHKTFGNLHVEATTLESQFSEALGTKSCEFLATVSHQHIYGLIFKLLWPIFSGRTFFVESIEYPNEFNQYKDLKYFALISSPAFLKRNINESLPSSASCHAVFSSGGPLPQKIARATNAVFRTLTTEVLGSTETGGIAFKSHTSLKPKWTVFTNVHISIDTETECMRVESPYFPEQSILTEDRIVITDDGFEILGRKDRVAKIEDKRVSLAALESRISDLPEVSEARVIPHALAHRQTLAAFITLNNEGKRILEDVGKRQFNQKIVEHLKPYFEQVVTPRVFRFLDSLPTDTQGKTPLWMLEDLLK